MTQPVGAADRAVGARRIARLRGLRDAAVALAREAGTTPAVAALGHASTEGRTLGGMNATLSYRVSPNLVLDLAVRSGMRTESGEAAAVAILCGSVPTGSGAYVLAKQMGGDAPMIASILTLQVICAAVTIPFVLSLLG